MGFLKKLNKTIKDNLDIDLEKEAKQLISDAISEVAGENNSRLLNTAKGLISSLKESVTSNLQKKEADVMPKKKRSEPAKKTPESAQQTKSYTSVKYSKEQEAERQRKAEIEAREEELEAGFTFKLRSGGTVRSLQEAFNEDYPYLRIGVYMVKTGQSADRNGGTISHYDSETTFGEIRSFKGECVVTIEGRSTPQSLEKQFRDLSGLVIKICYNNEDDERYYISKDSSEYKKHICDINREFQEAGYYKADIS